MPQPEDVKDKRVPQVTRGDRTRSRVPTVQLVEWEMLVGRGACLQRRSCVVAGGGCGGGVVGGGNGNRSSGDAIAVIVVVFVVIIRYCG